MLACALVVILELPGAFATTSRRCRRDHQPSVRSLKPSTLLKHRRPAQSAVALPSAFV